VSHELRDDGRYAEEVAKVFGVPFEVIPFKATEGGAPPAPVKRYHVHALPGKTQYEIRFPRVEGYAQAVKNRVVARWEDAPSLVLEPGRIPPEVEVKALHESNEGRLSLSGPGRVDEVTLKDFRAKRRLQELIFDVARTLTRDFLAGGQCEIPAHALFPQLARIVERYVTEKVRVQPPADRKDLFLAPYYGWLVERLLSIVGPDTSQGEAPEVPRYETSRGPGSTAEVDFWTTREVREINKSHLNFVVLDTKRWEQSAAYRIDRHALVDAFVKNAGMGFAIPYLHNGQMHDYVPDFLIRLNTEPTSMLILETKGFDPLAEIKQAAAERWVAAVNADGTFGEWRYSLTKNVSEIDQIIERAAARDDV
jgi:type III restriction enzyme